MMGRLIALLAFIGVAFIWEVHSFIDTPYDWLLFVLSIGCLAWALPDEIFVSWWKMGAWTVRQTLKYNKRV